MFAQAHGRTYDPGELPPTRPLLVNKQHRAGDRLPPGYSNVGLDLVGEASILFGYADAALCRVLPRCIRLHRLFAL